MTLLLSRCESVVLHALGASVLPPEISVLELVNRAGVWLCSFPWSWQERIVTIATVSAQNYVNLPAGTVEVHRVQYRNGWLDATTLGAIMDRRANAVVSGAPACYAIDYDQTAAGVLTPRIELYPTPSSSDASGITAHIRLGWVTPFNGADSSRIQIPDWLEPLYIEALIAFAMGYQERDVADVGTRIAAVQAGPLFAAATRQDASIQTNHGQMRGGAVPNHGWWSRARNFRVQP